MSPSQIIYPTVLNVTLTQATHEYSLALPAGCQHFSFQCRTGFDVQFAFASGKVAGIDLASAPLAPYATLKSGSGFDSPEKLSLKPTYETIYFASAQAGVVVEVVAWS